MDQLTYMNKKTVCLLRFFYETEVRLSIKHMLRCTLVRSGILFSAYRPFISQLSAVFHLPMLPESCKETPRFASK